MYKGYKQDIIFVADLDNQLMEELFLLACPQVLIVVVDTAVLALLLGVVVVHCLLQYIWNRIWQPVIFHSSSFLSYNKRVIG